MAHDILNIVQLVINVGTLFVAGFVVGKLHSSEKDIKRYRQIQEQAEREIEKYARK